MICDQLTAIAGFRGHSFSRAGLEIGSRMQEYIVRPGCQLSDKSLIALREGKDRAIDHTLAGGNGFAEPPRFFDPVELSAFDMGCVQERRDLRSLLVWQKSLRQCFADRKKGVA